LFSIRYRNIFEIDNRTKSNHFSLLHASNVFNSGSLPKSTPVSQCLQRLSFNDVRRGASAETFAAYDRILTRNALAQESEFNWCLATGCNAGQLSRDENEFMICHPCDHKQCVRHQRAWHDGETCAPFDHRVRGQQAIDEARQREEEARERQIAEQREHDAHALKEKRAAEALAKAKREAEVRDQNRRDEEMRATEAMLDTVSKKCPGGTCG
jgi:hypothetical protein